MLCRTHTASQGFTVGSEEPKRVTEEAAEPGLLASGGPHKGSKKACCRFWPFTVDEWMPYSFWKAVATECTEARVMLKDAESMEFCTSALLPS